MSDIGVTLELRARNEQAVAALRAAAAEAAKLPPGLRAVGAAGVEGGAGATRLAEALTRVGTTADTSAADLRGASQAATALGASYAGLGAPVAGVQASHTAAAGAVGTRAAQFNDVFVMAAAGQAPMMLAIQQGTQITQEFGNAGAAGAVNLLKAGLLSMLSPVNLVTIAVLAGGVALAQWGMRALSAGEETATLENRVKALVEATRDYTGSARDAAAPIEELRQRYGSLADEVQRALQAQRDLRRETAEAAVRDLLADTGFAVPEVTGTAAAERAIRDMLERMRVTQAALTPESAAFFDFSETYAEIDAAIGRLEAMRARIAEVADAFGITTAAAERLAIATREMQEAGSDAGRIEAADRLLGVMREVFGSIAAADAATDGLASALAEAVRQGADIAAVAQGLPGALGEAAEATGAVAGGLDDAADAASRLAGIDISGPIQAAAGAASALAGRLSEVLGRMSQVARFRAAQQQIAADGKVYSGRGGDPRTSNQQGRGEFVYSGPPLDASNNIPVFSASGGGGGGGGSSRPEAGSLAALQDQSIAAMRVLDQAVAGVNAKVKLGLMATAEGADAIENAQRRAAEALAELLPQLDALGPKGAAAAEQIRAWVTDLVAEIGTATDSLGESLSKSFANGFASFVVNAGEGEDAMRRFSDTVLSEMARIAAQRFTDSVISPLVDSVMGAFGGGGGLLGGLTSAVTGAFGGGLTAAAKGEVFDGPGISAWSSRIVDRPTFFAFAKGAAVMGEAGAEAVMPLKRTASGELGVIAQGAGGNVTVNVINQSGGEVRQSSRDDGQGGRILDIVIERVKDALAGDVASGRGGITAAMEGAYGLRRVGR